VGDTIELSVLEFDVLWEHLRLGPFPTVLDINPHGATRAERADLSATAWTALEHRGLAQPTPPESGPTARSLVPHPVLANRLRLLARPEWELDARIDRPTAEPRTTALIATRRTQAVVAQLHPDRLILRTAPADRLAHEALALLPPHPPGAGASITLPATVLDEAAARAGSNPTALIRALESRGVGHPESRKIAEVSAGVTRFAHLGAARTRPPHPRRRAPYVVSVYDTTTGRYLFTRKPSGGRMWVTLIPATDVAILRQLSELLAELDGS
jgi:hypothetical protein